MLKAIEIQNYKSIRKLKINLGRVNLLIGENGCGKSNIIESVCIAAAAEADKLDNNFLTSRGIRVTSPILMRSNFNESDSCEPVVIELTNFEDERVSYRLQNLNEFYSQWTCDNKFFPDVQSFAGIEEELLALKKPNSNNVSISEVEELLKRAVTMRKSLDFESDRVNDFVIYSPENSALRNFYQEGQLEPLGINGAGLLKLLKVINETDSEGLSDIKNALELFDWYEDIKIPSDIDELNDKVEIKDRYIKSVIDQRSANEGFLFVLFYFALIVSKDTPKIFAIDNVDTSLNPKMCTKMMRLITKLAEKYGKQIFLTTHNPAVLNGINIRDENQKLFVISRNNSGETIAKNISSKKEFKSADGGSIKFSEAFLRGYLGGLPKGFN